MQDAGEASGVTNVTVVIYNTNDVALATNVTDTSGNYTFTNLLPGDYTIGETNPTGWVSVADADGNMASLTASNGEGCAYVLPGTGQQGIPLRSVNTGALDVTLYRIGDRNLLDTVLGYDFRSAWEALREEFERVLPERNAELEAFLEAVVGVDCV